MHKFNNDFKHILSTVRQQSIVDIIYLHTTTDEQKYELLEQACRVDVKESGVINIMDPCSSYFIDKKFEDTYGYEYNSQ